MVYNTNLLIEVVKINMKDAFIGIKMPTVLNLPPNQWKENQMTHKSHKPEEGRSILPLFQPGKFFILKSNASQTMPIKFYFNFQQVI